MKLYFGVFHHFATGEGHHIVLATFLCEDHEDPNWIFYRQHCQNWDHQDRGDGPNFDQLKSAWEYYSHGIKTYLIEEAEEKIAEEVTVTTHDVPEELILELQRHLGKKRAEMIVQLAKYGLQKFVHILHYNLS